MISEFIDGLLNFHFLQNALITALVIGIVGGAVGNGYRATKRSKEMVMFGRRTEHVHPF